MVALLALAVALKVRFAGWAKEALLIGDVKLTTGGTCGTLTITDTAVEVLDAPVISVATAVNR